MKVINLLALLVLYLALEVNGQDYLPDPDPLVQQQLEKWQDLKFGLMMHWGPYSQWGVAESWSICPEDQIWCLPDTVKNYFAYKTRYEKLINTFNPTRFDPKAWAQIARNAGMKYVVFTAKHHDGFCMFDSQYTDYKITSKDCPFHSNPNADITKAVFTAFRNEEFWIGAYFSKPDWHSPDYWWPHFPPFDHNVNYDPDKYRDKWNNFVNFTHNQVMELCSDYGKIDIFWFDGNWVKKREENKKNPEISGFTIKKEFNQDIRMDELVDKIRIKQPGAIIVDRGVEGKNQNYETPENTVPDRMLPYPWESCMILGGGWSYTPHARMMPARKLVHLLCDIEAKGGN